LIAVFLFLLLTNKHVATDPLQVQLSHLPPPSLPPSSPPLRATPKPITTCLKIT